MARRPWLVPVGPRIVKYYDFCLLGCVPEHLDRFWAVLVVSGAQNRPITSFFDTPWTFFAQNVAKVYGGRSYIALLGMPTKGTKEGSRTVRFRSRTFL